MSFEVGPEGELELTGLPYKLPEMFRLSTVDGLNHGDIAYIDRENWVSAYDRGNELHVNGEAAAYPVTGIRDLYNEVCGPISRVIMIDTNDKNGNPLYGVILDISSDPVRIEAESDYVTRNAQFEPVNLRMLQQQIGYAPIPVLALAYDETSLEAITNYLDREYGITVFDCPLKDFLEEMGELEDDGYDEGDEIETVGGPSDHTQDDDPDDDKLFEIEIDESNPLSPLPDPLQDEPDWDDEADEYDG
jgi:hypothetical protein